MAMIHSADDMERLVLDRGILPFFKNEIEGFSIEEHTAPHLWFSDYEDGPWEWKSNVIGGLQAAYGKLFFGRAAYVRLDLYAHLLNVRRHGRTLQVLASTPGSRSILGAIAESESLLSTEIRRQCGFARKASKQRSPGQHTENLDSLLTNLQMQTALVIASFEYRHTADGRPYGWGIARYTTPETLYPDLFLEPLPAPEVSAALLRNHLSALMPTAPASYIERFIMGQ